jgi:quercetin dioxygenase-like cupin family protein
LLHKARFLDEAGFFLRANRFSTYIILKQGDDMPVVKYDDMKLAEVRMEGVQGVSKANVIGLDNGWATNTMRVFRLAAKGFTPRHQHDWEHVNYIIKGKGQVRIGEEVHEVKEKDFAFVPPNIEHQFENPYDEDLEFICIVPDRGAH